MPIETITTTLTEQTKRKYLNKLNPDGSNKLHPSIWPLGNTELSIQYDLLDDNQPVSDYATAVAAAFSPDLVRRAIKAALKESIAARMKDIAAQYGKIGEDLQAEFYNLTDSTFIFKPSDSISRQLAAKRNKLTAAFEDLNPDERQAELDRLRAELDEM